MHRHIGVARTLAVLICLALTCWASGGSVGPAGARRAAAPARSVAAVGEHDSSTAQVLMLPAYQEFSIFSDGIPAFLVASGFAANERIAIQFGPLNIFSGAMSSALFTLSGVADGTGQLSTQAGAPPLPLLTIQSNLPVGVYYLRAEGLTSGDVAGVLIKVPFATSYDSTLQCPNGSLLPGQQFTVSGGNVAPNSMVVATLVNGGAPVAWTMADGSGNYSFSFTAPPNIISQAPYTVLLAGAAAGGGSAPQEVERSCPVIAGVTPTASPTVTPTPSPSRTGTATVVVNYDRSIVALPGQTNTPSVTATPRPTHTPTRTATPRATDTPTLTATPISWSTPAATSSTPMPDTSATPVAHQAGTRAPAASMQLQLAARAVVQGQTETAIVRAAPFARLTFSVTYDGQSGQLSETTHADGTGRASFAFLVMTGPGRQGSALGGTVTVQLAPGAAAGTPAATRAHFSVYAPLNLSLKAGISRQQGMTLLSVQIRVARPGQATATVQLPGSDGRVISSSGTIDGRSPLVLWLPLGSLHGRMRLQVAVQVTSREGIVLSQTLPVAVPA